MGTERRAFIKGILAAILVGIAGVLVVGLKPLLVTAYIEADHLTPGKAGLLVALDMGGAMLGNLLGSWRLYSLRRPRVAAVGLLMILVGNVGSLASVSFPALAAARLITGFGAGVSASVMAAVLSSTRSPERFFALYSFAAFMTSAGAMWLSGLMLRTHGPGLMFGGLATITVLPLLTTAWLPSAPSVGARRAGAPPVETRPAWRAGPGVVTLLLGTLLYYAITGGIYSFMAEMGLHRGIAATAINDALAAAQIAAAIGSIVPFLLRDRLGRALPIVVTLLISLGCLPAFLVSTSPLWIATAMSAFAFAWLMFFPYLMGLCSALDSLGRLGTLDLAVQYAGLAIGPAAAGFIAQQAGYGVLIDGAAAGYLIATALLLQANGRARRTPLMGVQHVHE